MKGTYALAIEIEKDINLQIGRLGRFKFPAGFYLYIGSAQNNLEKRIQRHLRKEKKLFWHIDYLLNSPQVKARRIWARKGRWECSLAKKMILDKRFRIPIPGFGSTDCRCKAHLFLNLKEESEAEFLHQNNFSLLDCSLKSDKFQGKEEISKVKPDGS